MKMKKKMVVALVLCFGAMCGLLGCSESSSLDKEYEQVVRKQIQKESDVKAYLEIFSKLNNEAKKEELERIKKALRA